MSPVLNVMHGACILASQVQLKLVRHAAEA